MSQAFPSDTHPNPYPYYERLVAEAPFERDERLGLCPGETLAITIAQAGIEALLQAGVDLKGLAENVTYRPSANCRIPLFVYSR
jgi:hypothetical protein